MHKINVSLVEEKVVIWKKRFELSMIDLDGTFEPLL